MPDAFFLFSLTHHSIALPTRKKKNPPPSFQTLSFPDPLCSTCDALASALSEVPSGSSKSALDADCRSCCTPDDGDGASSSSSAASSAASSDSSPLTKASSAILEVCRSRLRAHRHVDEFVKHKLKLFKGQVKLRDRYNSPPRIYFLDAKGKRLPASGDGGSGSGGGGASPVRVDHWRTEDIESFLRERLVEDFKGKERASSSTA